MAPLTGLIRSLLVMVLLPALAGEAVRQSTIRTPPPLIIHSMAGSDLFRFYCASCHGADGSGNGPVGTSLKTAPSDLTTLSRRHGGSFARADIELYVTGDDLRRVGAHGSKDMPVWGPIFRALDPDDRTRKVRIANLMEYLESIQRK